MNRSIMCAPPGTHNLFFGVPKSNIEGLILVTPMRRSFAVKLAALKAEMPGNATDNQAIALATETLKKIERLQEEIEVDSGVLQSWSAIEK